MTMTLTGGEEEDQSSYFIKLKLGNCRLLCYNFRAFLQGYVMAFYRGCQGSKDLNHSFYLQEREWKW